VTDNSATREISLGKGIGSLTLGASTETISKLDGFVEPAVIQDESSAVHEYESLMRSMGPGMGLDPDEFQEMIAAMKLESASEVRWVPSSKNLPVLFFRDSRLVRIVLSSECRPILEAREIFEMPAKVFYDLVISRADQVYQKRNELVIPAFAMRFTLPKKSDYEDGEPIELLVLENNSEEELVAEGYRKVSA